MSFKSTSRNALFALACCGLILGACAAYEAGEAPAAAAPEPPPPPELTEEQKIIARYIEASGGEDAIRAHTSMTIKGGFEMPAMGMSGDTTTYAMAPDKTLAMITLPGMGEIVNGTNGDVAWAEDPMQGPRVLDGDMLADARRASMRNWSTTPFIPNRRRPERPNGMAKRPNSSIWSTPTATNRRTTSPRTRAS